MGEPTATEAIDPESLEFYRRSLRILGGSGVPFLLGGAYAFERYTGISRHTKDLDVFVRRSDRDAALAALSDAGYSTELTFPHWLSKAHHGDDFIDVIHGAGNGVAMVDDEWFAYAVEEEALGVPVSLTPAEEMIWSKAFVMERERYDGADVAHLIRARGSELDWGRLIRRFAEHWPVLLSHLVLFTFVYPDERDAVPRDVFGTLVERLVDSSADGPQADPSAPRTCRGTLISRQQYLVDVEQWGYRDGRLPPTGSMTEEEVAAWTKAIWSED